MTLRTHADSPAGLMTALELTGVMGAELEVALDRAKQLKIQKNLT